MSIVMVLTSLVLQHHGHSLVAIAISHTFHSAGMFAFTIPLGKLADRYGRNFIMYPGVAVSLIGAALVAFALVVRRVGMDDEALLVSGMALSLAVPVLALVTNKLLSPNSRAGERQITYESGMEPIGGAWIQFNIRYYMFALVFVVFDVETVFLYPWAVAFHRLGLLAFIEALIFIAILVVALAYAWRKGALEWS